MENVTEMLRQGKKKEIWEKYCGFLDLNIEEFMKIQNDLLIDQIERLSKCELGRKLLGPEIPKSVEEFREKVPLTTYSDYSKYLINKREDVLPEKPYAWTHTSGKSGEYEYKWVPYTKKMYDITGQKTVTFLILSSCRRKGDIVLKEGDKCIATTAPPPYVSGLVMQSCLDEFNMTMFPPFKKSIKMDFQERIQEGIKSAFVEGLDFLFGLSTIVLKIGNQISQRDRSTKDKELSKELRKPKVILRLLKAFIKAKLDGRNILPKDIWKIKGISCGGTDTSIYKDKIKRLWGKTPKQVYVSAEFGLSASQSWNNEDMILFPDNNFWEFIPVEEYRKMVNDKSYIPHTLLISEVKPNSEYVIVGTNFHGGALVRYIIGDLIKITSLEDKEAGLNLPQMTFFSRIDDILDIGGFTRLTEKTIWNSIEESGLDYEEWTIRKEYIEKKPMLHLYIELRDKNIPVSEIEERIHESLKTHDEPYRELETMLDIKPLKATKLSIGTFRRYFEERKAAGADLAHMKPPHINSPNSVIKSLLRMSSWQI